MRTKGFLVKNWKWIVFAMWIALTAYTCYYVANGGNIWVKGILIAVCLLAVMFSFRFVNKRIDREEAQKKEDEKQKLQELKNNNLELINLVNKVVQKALYEYKNQLLGDFHIDKKMKYLIAFSNLLEEERVKTGKEADSFTIAGCLLFSLLDYPIITLGHDENADRTLSGYEFGFILDIALKCAYEIISEPFFFIEKDGIWVKRENKKVDIVVPEGITKEDDLRQTIRQTIYDDEKSGNRMSIGQLAIFFKILYLKCQ